MISPLENDAARLAAELDRLSDAAYDAAEAAPATRGHNAPAVALLRAHKLLRAAAETARQAARAMREACE